MRRYVAILLFGPPGAGKGTQSRILGGAPRVLAVDMGMLLRSTDRKTDLGREVARYSDSGDLVPDDVVMRVLVEHLEESERRGDHDVLVLAGVPRTEGQARALGEHVDVQRVISLTASDESILKQRLRRRAEERDRPDDADPIVVEHRFEAFLAQRDRVLACYDRRRTVEIDALRSPWHVARDILGSVSDLDPMAARTASVEQDGSAFEAVITDMDGVLTQTARLHERAWKELFDSFLAKREGQTPFSSADYRTHVDGKPRYQGAADFLASRGIELPRGEPSDDPGSETVHGLGNRKNELFLELLENEGVDVYEDVTRTLARWRRSGLKLAAVSASRNCRRVLNIAGLDQRFDVIADGETAAELGLDGKQGILVEAARRLCVEPERAVVLEDATAGVRAGRAAGFGIVIGIARDDVGREVRLRVSGADAVVSGVSSARFRRRIPHVRDCIEELSAWQGDRSLAVFLDFDGTLTPIVDHPDDARLSNEMRAVLERLAASRAVAILSGRDREDVAARVGLGNLVYAGNHGFDIAGGGVEKTLPEAVEALDDVGRAEEELRPKVEKVTGAVIERKRFSVAAHFRQVESPAAIREIERAVESVRVATGLRVRKGKRVLELEPAIAWNKGRALQWLVDALPGLGASNTFVVYVGDDETDEDAFFALQGRGAGVRVGSEVSTSLADYRVASPDEVRELLALWVGSRD